jgi:hypothetical protein
MAVRASRQFRVLKLGADHLTRQIQDPDRDQAVRRYRVVSFVETLNGFG